MQDHQRSAKAHPLPALRPAAHVEAEKPGFQDG